MAIQIRRGTDAEWESNNSNIVAGEPAVTLDTGRFFVGTGNGEFVELQKKGNGGDGLTDDIKQALLQIASKVAYIDEHGQDYYDALESALYPDATLVSISAVYTQSGTVYDTDTLDSLKSDLVVTATYSDSSTATVTAYTLSGTLTAGTSTITVAYGGKTTTFDVTVSQRTIRVFKGKGISGTSIIDNANRALSEPFAFNNVAPIKVQFVDFSATKASFKNTTTDVNTIDTIGPQIAPESVIGQSTLPSGYDGWIHTSDELVIVFKPTSQPYEAYQFPVTSGYARFLFANDADQNVPISETIQGIIKINGIPYHLVEADVSDFE